jgi:hypothetical protein
VTGETVSEYDANTSFAGWRASVGFERHKEKIMVTDFLSLRSVRLSAWLSIVLVVGLAVVLTPRHSGAEGQASAALAERVIDDLWNGTNLESIDNLYAERFYVHSPNGRVKTLWTPATWRDLTIDPMHKQYPDLALVTHIVIEDGDWAAVHFTASGTRSGEVIIDRSVPNQAGTYDYRNIRVVSATGVRDTWDGILMFHFEDSKIVEEWWYWNANLP